MITKIKYNLDNPFVLLYNDDKNDYCIVELKNGQEIATTKKHIEQFNDKRSIGIRISELKIPLTDYEEKNILDKSLS